MIRSLKIMFWFLFIPLVKMEKVDSRQFLENPKNKDIIYLDETLYSVYDNSFNSFLITNTRIVSVFKLRNRVNIFSVPLFQLGTLSTYSFKTLNFKMICITSSPGFNFYWFFKYDVSMENLSNEISKVVADVQISGGSKLQKIF